jgi:hypothetical protein
MSSNDITVFKNFQVSKVNYDEPKKLDNGGKMIYVKFNQSHLRLQTPQCFAPFGVNVYKNEDTNNETHSIDLSFRGMDVKKGINDFYNKMKEFDEMNISKGYEYQQSWFRKKYPSKEVIEALYTTMIKHPKDKNGEITNQYPSTFKVKLPYVNGEYKLETYDKNNKLINLKDVQTKGSKIVAIVKCNGIWIAGGKFGMSWKAEQLQIIPQSTITGYCIRMVSDEMINIQGKCDTKVVKPSQKLEVKKEVESVKNTLIEDSDEEEEEAVQKEEEEAVQKEEEEVQKEEEEVQKDEEVVQKEEAVEKEEAVQKEEAVEEDEEAVQKEEEVKPVKKIVKKKIVKKSTE